MKAIDLFAGAGGFSLAAHQCDIDVVAAIELDKAASITYKANLIEQLKAPTKLINGDINEVDLPDLMKELKLISIIVRHKLSINSSIIATPLQPTHHFIGVII
jgi:DNA (cytosine-5)-methyltransferase 1